MPRRKNQTQIEYLRWPIDRPATPQVYPSGICVETELGYYYIKGDRKLRIPNERVMQSWEFPFSVRSSEKAIEQYKRGRLGFRDGTLIKNVENGTLYLVSDNKIRKIVGADILSRLGISSLWAVDVSPEDLTLHTEGEVLK